MQSLELRAVQFLSRSFCRDKQMLQTGTLVTKGGLSFQVYLKVQFGTPLLVGPGERTQVRPNYAQPWLPQEGPSIGAVQWVDPYAEIRWPSYAMVTSNALLDCKTLNTAAECDILQRMRSLVAFEIFELPELKAMTDQLLGHDGYRFGYWTPDRDFVGNPVAAPGKYVKADRGEPVGPGHASLFGFGERSQMHTLSLVWSQAFSFPNRTNAAADEAAIRKRAQQIKLHYNSKGELTRADNALRQHDVKVCVRFGAAAIDAALRFYCAEWNVPFPTAPIPFDQKIERILQQAGRPSYQVVDQAGLRDLLHLYRARNAIHEGDCFYKDDQLGTDVYCEVPHARHLFGAAQRFAYWIDSQA